MKPASLAASSRDLSRNRGRIVAAGGVLVAGGLLQTAIAVKLYAAPYAYYILLGMFGAVLVWSVIAAYGLRGEAKLLLVMGVAVLLQTQWSRVHQFPKSYAHIAILLVMLLWLGLRLWLGERVRLGSPLLAIPLGIFLALAGLAALIGLAYGNAEATIARESGRLACYLAFFVTVDSLRNRAAIERLVIMMGILAVGFATFEIADFALHPISLRLVTRNVIVFFFAFCFLLVWAVESKRRLARLLLMCGLIVISLAILLTQVRGVYLACFVAVCAYIIYTLRRHGGRLLRIVLASVLIATVLGIAFIYVDFPLKGLIVGLLASRMRHFTTMQAMLETQSLLAKLSSFRAILSRVQHSPLWGYGLASTVDYADPTGLWIRNTSYFDSTWFTILLKMGIVGVASYFAVFGAFCRSTFRLLFRTQDEFARRAALALAIALPGMFWLSLVNSFLVNYPMIVIVAALMAIVSLLAEQASEDGVALEVSV